MKSALRSLRTLCFVYLAVLCSKAALATGFTFDFTDPVGLGTNFPDTISLNTIGAVRDAGDRPVGFTQFNQGNGDGDGRAEVATLTPDGLRVQLSSVASDTHPDRLLIGVPFPTTGSGDVSITARFHAFSRDELDVNFEQAGVGWGAVDAQAVNHMLFGLGVFNVGGDNVQTRYKNEMSTEQFTMWPNDPGAENIAEIVLQAPPIAGSVLTGVFTFRNGLQAVHSDTTDQLTDPLLGSASAYGYFIVDLALLLGGEHTLDVTLSSISFSGDDLVVPEIVPEPSGLVLLAVGGIGLFGLGFFRRRGPRHAQTCERDPTATGEMP